MRGIILAVGSGSLSSVRSTVDAVGLFQRESNCFRRMAISPSNLDRQMPTLYRALASNTP